MVMSSTDSLSTIAVYFELRYTLSNEIVFVSLSNCAIFISCVSSLLLDTYVYLRIPMYARQSPRIKSSTCYLAVKKDRLFCPSPLYLGAGHCRVPLYSRTMANYDTSRKVVRSLCRDSCLVQWMNCNYILQILLISVSKFSEFEFNGVILFEIRIYVCMYYPICLTNLGGQNLIMNMYVLYFSNYLILFSFI